jgi:hypothetical protein
MTVSITTLTKESSVMLGVALLYCYTENRSDECRFTEQHSAELRSTERHPAECYSSECHAECRIIIMLY